MCLSSALLLLALFGSVSCARYLADFNMAGVTGSVWFDSTEKTANINLTGIRIETCGSCMLSLMEFPVMYGHVAQPCEKAHVGERVFTFLINASSSVQNIATLFEQRSNLEAHSLMVETCDGKKACTTVLASSKVITLQARFFRVVAGNVYLRQVSGEPGAALLSDLVGLNQSNSTVVDIFLSQSSAAGCEALLGSLNPNSLTALGQLKVGSPLEPVKCRLEIPSLAAGVRFALFNLSSGYLCSEFLTLEPKVVSALMDMRGIKGYVTFQQSSPFELTTLTVNLTNLDRRVGSYHVHLFPTPQLRSPSQTTCSDDNLGGHWNPFGLDTKSSTYPRLPGSTHDQYEVGDLSSRHGSFENSTNIQASFTDWNLPLFGQNSIVGRSLVLHQLDGSRFSCASIGYPGEVVSARAIFQTSVVGSILFTQLKGNPYSDVSVFLDLSYGQPNTSATQKHNWHIHTFPISTETDSDESRCVSTGGHWNPYQIDNSVSSYKVNCRPDCPFSCEIGDLSRKHKLLNLGPDVGKVTNKVFLTDTTSWVYGMGSMIGRSVVIHGPNEAGHRIACANITIFRFPSAQSGSWHGAGSSSGHVHFFQTSPQGPTNLNVSLTALEARAGGYHVHLLPVKTGPGACSNENVMGHFNPYGINASMSPASGNGTVDQYEIGDISGKFGTLRDLNEFMKHFVDSNMPLSGPNSVIGRSLVIHYQNGSRMQCSDITAQTFSDGSWVFAKAVFNSSMKGTVTLSQQSFPDGSYSDVTLLVDVSINQTSQGTKASWYIAEAHAAGCPGPEDTYNPFNMTAQSSNCSPLSTLACQVGDLTSKHGSISLTQRELYTDTHLQLAGDFTVVYRSLVLRAGDGTVACVDILPESPSAQQVFPRVTSFSRYNFRKRVAGILEIHLSRVSILPGALAPMPGGKCQEVNFMVSGNIDQKKLALVKDSERMGEFRQTKECRSGAVSGLLWSSNGNVYLLYLAMLYVLQTHLLH